MTHTWEWKWDGMGTDWMGMGENTNVKMHCRSSLVENLTARSRGALRAFQRGLGVPAWAL